MVVLFVGLFVIVGGGSWVWNAFELTSCDFKPDYRCEAIHGAGFVFPPLSIITVWFADDSEAAR